jgi:carbonic anhydrase
MSKQEKFVTAINCIDGRVQLPVIHYMKRKFKADYVDLVTAPGADKMLAEGIDKTLRRKVTVSVEAHGSKVIAVVGHYGCAGAPESKAEHLAHVRLGVKCVMSWKLEVEAVGLWVNKKWEVEEVS